MVLVWIEKLVALIAHSHLGQNGHEGRRNRARDLSSAIELLSVLRQKSQLLFVVDGDCSVLCRLHEARERWVGSGGAWQLWIEALHEQGRVAGGRGGVGGGRCLAARAAARVGGQWGGVLVGAAQPWVVKLTRGLQVVQASEQRWVIAIETKIQLPNTLPIILNCVIGIINWSNWVEKANFQLLITNY